MEPFSDLGGKHFGGRRKHFQRKVESISRTGGNRFMLRGKANQGIILKGGKIFRAKLSEFLKGGNIFMVIKGNFAGKSGI